MRILSQSSGMASCSTPEAGSGGRGDGTKGGSPGRSSRRIPSGVWQLALSEVKGRDCSQYWAAPGIGEDALFLSSDGEDPLRIDLEFVWASFFQELYLETRFQVIGFDLIFRKQAEIDRVPMSSSAVR
jgi:hypothetical protein